jgi:tRNA pseudouridine38-40 synthase
MTQRFALGVQYDGRDWLGWQSQPGARTIQDTLEAVLTQFADEPIRISAAGRTDTGVHALGQVVHFDSNAQRPAHSWVRACNSLLPASIALTWAQPVSEQFHARFSAISRTYHYVLYLDAVRPALLAGRAGWCYYRLDVPSMQSAANYLVGRHDFSALRSVQCQARSPVKTLHRLELAVRGRFLVVTLHADAFLHHMVRNIIGCLIAVGRGKNAPEWLRDVLDSRERAKAAPTFMADGLYLGQVEYPLHFGIPPSGSLYDAFAGLLEPD